MATIDSARGKECDFVVLGLGTLGGSEYGLGIFDDVRRMRVSLFRGEMGLLIVGDIDVGNSHTLAFGWQKCMDNAY